MKKGEKLNKDYSKLLIKYQDKDLQRVAAKTAGQKLPTLRAIIYRQNEIRSEKNIEAIKELIRLTEINLKNDLAKFNMLNNI